MWRPVPLLATLALLWGLALAGAWWLGLTALGDPGIEETPTRLVLRASLDDADPNALRTALLAAGMAADGAHWTLQRPSVAAAGRAIEVRTEDARNLDLLPDGFEVSRLGGEPALRLAIPDRGQLTETLVRPIAEARIDDALADAGAELREQRTRRDGARIELWWVLTAHPRGEAAPDLEVPRLVAPQLPLRRDTTGR